MLLNAPLLGQRPSRCVGRGLALRVEAKKRRHCGDCKGHEGPAPAKEKAAASAAAAAAAAEPAAAAQPAECAAPAPPAAPSTPRTQEPQDGRRLDKWPLKSDLYLLRSDGERAGRDGLRGAVPGCVRRWCHCIAGPAGLGCGAAHNQHCGNAKLRCLCRRDVVHA